MIIAVDTGGPKTLIGRFNDGELTNSVKIPTPKNIYEYIQKIEQHIRDLSDNQPISTISVALPGIVKNGVAVWCVNLDWVNLPVKDMISQKFPESRVIIENDANLAGLASARRLDPIPKSCLYVGIGTGIGTALLLNGQLHSALLDCEGGHMMLEFDGEKQTWEQLASGRTLQSLFGELSQNSDPTIWPEVAERINLGLRALVPFIQPEVIVIGGGIGTLTNNFSSVLSGLLAEQLPASIACPKIVPAPFPEKTTLYGCYDNAVSDS